jgi:hypothetical protein
MTVPLITSTISNPFTGTFGNGVVVPFLNSGTFVVPAGVSSVRVRVWGAGGYDGGGGGGFTMETITGLISGASIAVTVGAGSTSSSVFGGTSSFGSYCSATGGGSGSTSPARGGGVGAGGDINTTGGSGVSPSGGGVAGMWGNGGNGSSINGKSGNAGGGGGSTAGNVSGSGIFGLGGQYQSTTATVLPGNGFVSASIDFIGTGGGGPNLVSGINGGGGASNGNGGFPGGGAGSSSDNGGKGLVIVEY